MSHVAVRLLSERLRAALALAIGVVVEIVVPLVTTGYSSADLMVLFLLSYLVTYLLLTLAGFVGSPEDEVRSWAKRERGTFLQRYVFGTAPGPGVSIFIAGAALAVAMLWLPLGDDTPGRGTRVAISVVSVVVAWVSVVLSFTIAYVADNLAEDGRGLEFPGDDPPKGADYLYFALSVMTTFGTTDVTVAKRSLRLTVMVNAVIAFVFNTIIVAALVSALPN